MSRQAFLSRLFSRRRYKPEPHYVSDAFAIARLRERLGISERELVTMLGTSERVLAAARSGQYSLMAATLRKLCRLAARYHLPEMADYFDFQARHAAFASYRRGGKRGPVAEDGALLEPFLGPGEGE